MELPDFWTLSGIALALIGIGAAMITIPQIGRLEFRISRFCFVGTALLFEAKLVVWGMSDLTPMRLITVFVIGGMLAIGLVVSLRWIGEKEKGVSASGAKGAVIYAECKQHSKSSPLLTESLHYLIFSADTLPSMTGGFFTMVSDTAVDLSSIFRNSSDVYRCELTNYTDIPLFNIHIDLNVVYKNNNEIRFEGIYPINVDIITNDKNKPFVFYVANVDRLFGYVDIKNEISYDIPGKGDRATGVLNQAVPRSSRMLFLGRDKEATAPE
jgi:hypothetical protein